MKTLWQEFKEETKEIYMTETSEMLEYQIWLEDKIKEIKETACPKCGSKDTIVSVWCNKCQLAH